MAERSISTHLDFSANTIAIELSKKPWCNMTRHDDIIRLRHMLDHAREAVKMAEGKNRTALRNDRMLELTLV